MLQSQCYPENESFSVGEEIHYSVYYNWGFIWLDAGWVNFSVKDTSYQNQYVYYLDAYGSSHTSYDWLYKVRDSYKAYLDTATYQPLWFHRKNYEGGFEVNNKYFFDWSGNKVYSFTQNSKKPLSADTLTVPDCTFDVLSLIYYFRNIEFSGLEIDEKLPVISILDNEVYNLYIRYLGAEELKTRNGVKYKCRKFSAKLVEGTIFKGGEDLIVWVTDDKNKVPVLVEAKILIGSVKAYLDATKGLTNRVEAIIK